MKKIEIVHQALKEEFLLEQERERNFFIKSKLFLFILLILSLVSLYLDYFKQINYLFYLDMFVILTVLVALISILNIERFHKVKLGSELFKDLDSEKIHSEDMLKKIAFSYKEAYESNKVILNKKIKLYKMVISLLFLLATKTLLIVVGASVLGILN